MASSESEGFESADEGFEENAHCVSNKNISHNSRNASRRAGNHKMSDELEKQPVDSAMPKDQMYEKAQCDEKLPRDRHHRVNERRGPQKIKDSKGTNMKKLGTKISVDKSNIKDSDLKKPESPRVYVENVDVPDPHICETPPARVDCWEEDTNIKMKDMTPLLEKISESAEDKESPKPSSSGGWGGWGNWGMSSFLSSATESVSTLTSHVTQGITTVLESGIGAPDPEELARVDKLEEKKSEGRKPSGTEQDHVEVKCSSNNNNNSDGGGGGGLFGFSQIVSGMTKLVETTGSKVISGGLDTLESIGKKTMEVLQEGDPGLKKKRAMFMEKKTLLSQVLREAKEKAEQEAKVAEDKQAARRVHFETLFDDYQGLVHLEALEMLSKQSDIKLQSFMLSYTGTSLAKLQKSLKEVKDLCQLPDDEEDEGTDEKNDDSEWLDKLENAKESLGVPVLFDKIVQSCSEMEVWLQEHPISEVDQTEDRVKTNIQATHEKAIASLACFTAQSVEQFHKVAELLLIKDNRSPMTEGQSLQQITCVLSSRVSTIASRFSEVLSSPENKSLSDMINSLIVNVFFEASNSSSHIQEAFHLLIPILQVGILPKE